jgi:hypothetical protein
MFPPLADVAGYKGMMISVFLPIEVAGRKKGYLFTFKVSDVLL